METNVRIFSQKSRDSKPNPYHPGTKSYISHDPALNRLAGDMTEPVKQGNFTASPESPERTSLLLLNTLQHLRGPPTASTE
ncbi:hypothetical protein NUW54_g8742 [Trametes sanguinea]|uniref:Uncharacterized protein n=1 Tax=Trametes sanguinea TaxID=158606 RepID=A0ACC1PDT5_9APHY|nr:hypothetical protein NUW54_g8742 [Trametes sanguinea]